MVIRTPSKYRAKKTFVDGKSFDSKKEAKRYQDLKLLEKAGEISHLELQPRYDFVIEGVKCGYYKADFTYYDIKNDITVKIVEDVKGFKTPVYRLKKKLMKALYGIEILET